MNDTKMSKAEKEGKVASATAMLDNLFDLLCATLKKWIFRGKLKQIMQL
jgi:hypothetical protein